MKKYYGETGILPGKKELKNLLQKNYPSGHKEDSPRGSNCDTEIINYYKKDKNIRIFVKKTYLKGKKANVFQSEYEVLKDKFKNLIPNQVFMDFGNGDVFAFCTPIGIKIDIFKKENTKYLIQTLKNNPKLLKQIRFFIKGFEDLASEGKYIDLFGKENLIISDDNKLYYVDSFLVFYNNETMKNGTLENIQYIKKIINNLNSI